MPEGNRDYRLRDRELALLKPELFYRKGLPNGTIRAYAVRA